MPAVALRRGFSLDAGLQKNPLPQLLHTPAGLAILEIQGTIHAPLPDPTSSVYTVVGQLQFPLYEDRGMDGQEGPWMKKVYLYIGKHQRLTGEVKKLAKPMVVLDKDAGGGDMSHVTANSTIEGGAGLNILAIIRHKILFSSRPEPVGI